MSLQAYLNVKEESMKDKMDTLLHIALQKHATDIHFVQKKNECTVTLRGDFGIEPVHSSCVDKRLLNYLKFISHLDLGNGKTAQNGNFEYLFNHQYLQFRFSLIQTVDKQTAVLRILNNHEPIHIDNLSIDEHVLSTFKCWCKQDSGLVLLSGPTGSGKTTTLHALLEYIANSRKKRIVSLEDPIEIQDSSYVQLQVNEDAGFTYEYGIKELLRHDPDVLMLGEIRDPYSAKMLIRSALSGHLIFSTIHAKDCIEVLYRLQEFGIHHSDIKETLLGITSQRLFSNYQRNGKICLYEMFDQTTLSYYLKHHEVPHSYQKMETIIQQAITNKTIFYQE